VSKSVGRAGMKEVKFPLSLFDAPGTGLGDSLAYLEA